LKTHMGSGLHFFWCLALCPSSCFRICSRDE